MKIVLLEGHSVGEDMDFSPFYELGDDGNIEFSHNPLL